MHIKNWEKLKTRDSLTRMQLPVGDPLSNIFNTESMVFSWRSTTFRSAALPSLSWFKTWGIWRWTWSSISTWISATKQIARVTENIADENCEGWETWGVFDFSMNRWTLRKRLLKRQWFLVHFQLRLLSHSVDTTAEMFYGPRNESCTWRLLKAEYWWRSIQQTSLNWAVFINNNRFTRNQLNLHILLYFKLMPSKIITSIEFFSVIN